MDFVERADDFHAFETRGRLALVLRVREKNDLPAAANEIGDGAAPLDLPALLEAFALPVPRPDLVRRLENGEHFRMREDVVVQLAAKNDVEPVVDEKPVSHLDLQATVLDAMGLDYSEYSNRDEWAGYSMFRDIDPDRKRYYLTTDSEPDLTEVQFREYLIDGNALDWDNWSETGRTIDAQE